MNKKGITLQRERRDEVLGTWSFALCSVYFYISFIWMGYAEYYGELSLRNATMIYISYGVLFALTIHANYNAGKWVRTLISYLAMIAKLILVAPFRVFLHGIKGYIPYAKRELKRTLLMEVDRYQKER